MLESDFVNEKSEFLDDESEWQRGQFRVENIVVIAVIIRAYSSTTVKNSAKHI